MSIKCSEISTLQGRSDVICWQPRFLSLLVCLAKTFSDEENAVHNVVHSMLNKELILVLKLCFKKLIQVTDFVFL